MIENAILKYLGISPETVNRVDEICERVCDEYDIDSDEELWPYVEQTFTEEHGSNLSDEIAYLAFRNLRDALVESGKFRESELGWYVNGTCSSFTIRGEDA